MKYWYNIMPTSCSVYGCSNRFSKEKKIQFFTFPFKDEGRLAAWITAVCRKDWKPSKASRICSAHFRPQDFLHRPSTAWYPYIRRLKHDAVPSIFPNFPGHSGCRKTKNENFTSTVVKRESKCCTKPEATFTASEVCSNIFKSCSNKLDSYMEESNARSKENTEEKEDNSSESEKDQTIAKLRDKIRTLKQQIDKRDRKIRRMKELILRLRRHGSNVITWELQNENRMPVTVRRMCRRSVAPQITFR